MIPQRLSLALALTLALAPAPARAADDPPPSEPPAALTKPPKLLQFVHAVPPASLAARGAVDVKLVIDVDDKGKVYAVSVLESGGPEYDEAAVAAVKQFVFSPGEAGGKPVPVRITYTYHFLMKVAPPPPPAPPPQAPSPDGGVPPEPTPDGGTPPAPPTEATPGPGATTPTATRDPNAVPFGGRVLRKGDRVPVIGATVLIEPELVAETDVEGRFAFDAVPVGKRVVRVSGPGIDAVKSDEELKPGKKLDVTYYVTARQRYRSTVRGARPVREVVEQTLDVEEIKRIPGTQGDTLKAVQNLPGVARAAFGGGALIVWGSRPADTRVYVDGFQIPTLYHFGGLRSTVNSETVQSLTFTPGGYGAGFGRGLGGLVEIESRKPRTDGYHGFVQLDLIDGSFLIEGPITKKLSFGVSARRSWIDAFLPIFTSSDFQLSPKYWDYQVRLNYKATPRDDVSLFVFGSDDALELLLKTPDPKLQAQFASHTYYHRIIGSWQHRFADGGTLTVGASTGYSVPFQVNANLGNFTFSVDARRCPYDIRAVMRHPLSDNLRLDFGLDFQGDRWGLSVNAPATGMPREGQGNPMTLDLGVIEGKGNIYTNGFAPWAALQLSDEAKRFELTAGLRLETFYIRGSYDFPAYPIESGRHKEFDHAYFNPEGRLSARYQILPWMAIKGAFGYYHQAPGPADLFGPTGNPDLKPESATHWVFGFDFKPTNTLSISTEGFYKQMMDLVVPNNDRNGPALINVGEGRVYGGEILVRQQLWKGLFAWLSYTISRSERKDHPSDNWRLFQNDQTHILTAIASYQFGRGYQVGARFRYVTGNPSTPIIGSYLNLNSGGYIPINGPTYSDRLGDFNQLDIRFDKTWEFRLWKLGVYLDIQNVYYAKNPEGYQYNYNYTQRQPVAGLPILPAVGIRGDF